MEKLTFVKLTIIGGVLACTSAGRAQQEKPVNRVIGPPRFASPEGAHPLQLIAPPPADVVRTRTLEWVSQRIADDKPTLEEIGRHWGLGGEPLVPEQLFDLTIRSFSLADPETALFVQACALQRPALLAPEARLLEKTEGGEFYLANVGYYYGRYLVQRQMFDEGLTVLEKIPVADLVDPAGFLFHKAVCQHHLLMKEEGLATIEQLLKSTEGVPVRYTTVATLMQYDLEALQERSLEEISRKMSDVERRLNLGRAGQRVQKKEEEIIMTFDEIIKKIEDQQGGGGGGAGGQANRSTAPAGDSTIKGATAPGAVDPKKFDKQGTWGDLPPRARARAKELISREFPAHYRTAIEEFTRKGANRAANPGK
jgi:hypothetical protein